MNTELHKKVSGELCPDGNWQLSESIKTLLKFQIDSLPRTTVSQEETRYPTTPAGMIPIVIKTCAIVISTEGRSVKPVLSSVERTRFLDSAALRSK